ncbi:hypothetical protein I6J77_13615 [Rhodanobacter sp. FDAARGOS 1247]|uniref:DUF6861 domain-containing protein n=1 Tax=Rhodanobacter sp. FDAARGOS 1247 TaxID=2778082 RepID=UPI0019517878|nr:hypothetical protein [Rhodanobacter sp. FDAARGOS 1247]QRP63144.1 hypothetical protein I6J77_13615 [Rhodanobacter sp. FDAARGOS 1247]
MPLATSIQDSWNQLERWAGRQISGARNEARLISARADALQLAITLSEGLAVYRILRDFQHLDLDAVVNDIVAVLRQCLIVMLTSTGGGALIGGVAGGVFGVGVGAAPGVVIGAAAGAQMGEWILIFMGLRALSEYIVRDMPDIARAYWDGIRLAWSAASPSPLPQQPIRVDRFAIQHAAEKIARAHVAMFVLLLMGILAYLAKGRGDMGQLAEGVRSSRMGPKFADWMVRNEGRLKAEPRLREGILQTTRESSNDIAVASRPRNPPSPKRAPEPRNVTEKSGGKPAPDGFRTYKTHGINENPMLTPEGRSMVAQYEKQGFTRDEAILKTRQLMESGSTRPLPNPVETGDKFYKVVPKNSMPGPNSEFWMSKREMESLRGLNADQIGDCLGLPLESQQVGEFDVVQITAIRPSMSYTSRIAPTTQNGWAQSGGKVQTLLTDRSSFNAPSRTGIKFP